MSDLKRSADKFFTNRAAEIFSVLIVFAALIFLSVLIAIGACVFLFGLEAVSEARGEWRWLVLFAPLAGLLSGWVFAGSARESAHGNILVVGLLRRPQLNGAARVPRALLPVIVVATWLSHLVGMSVGREGTAVQMGAAVADFLDRYLNRWLDRYPGPGDGGERRRQLLLAGVAGGFSAVFGVPIAGAVFAFEVSRRGAGLPAPLHWRGRAAEFVPVLFVALLADVLARRLGATHALHGHFGARDAIHTPEILALLLTAVFCGLLASLFLRALHVFKMLWARLVSDEMWRPAIGGAIFGLILFFGDAHAAPFAGLGIPGIREALERPASFYAPLGKFAATVFSIGVGFKGGEVTPLFFIGSTVGSALAGLLGASVVVVAGVGLVACFGAAAGVPVAAAVMAGELFGPAAFAFGLPFCWLANRICGHARLYDQKPDL